MKQKDMVESEEEDGDNHLPSQKSIQSTVEVEQAERVDVDMHTNTQTRNNAFNILQDMFCQNIAFNRINRLVQIHKTRCLNQSDIDELPSRCKSEHLLTQFKSHWTEQCHRNPHSPSLLRATFSFINTKYRYVWIILTNCIFWCSFAANIMFMQLILQFLANEGTMTRKKAYVCAGGMAVSLFMIPLTIHFVHFQTALLFTNIRTALTALIYEKSLAIPKDLYNTSQIIHFMSDDIQKFEDLYSNLGASFGSLLLIATLIYLIATHGKLYILFGFALLLLLIPFFGSTAPLIAKYKKIVLSHTETRLKLIKEALNGYVNTKMYSWESSILNLVEDTRKQEVDYLTKKGRLTAFRIAVMTFSETVALAVVMLWYFWDHGRLQITIIYPTLILYNALKSGVVYYIPTTIQAYYEIQVSAKRLVAFLQTPELQLTGANNSSYPSVQINAVSFCWPNSASVSKRALSSINLSFESNTLVGIIGRVGSGKTTLLLSILGELSAQTAPNEGDQKDVESGVCINGKIGYCSQAPWIFNGSVKENILFGNAYDPEWYRKVVHSCSLDIDFDNLPHQDETIIGERGVNLSGGQKTRINLARCIYDKPMVLLLDDCLSSIDPSVATHIFMNLLHSETGLMKHTLRLFVTHQPSILPQMDHVVIMQNQTISHVDEYSKLHENEYSKIMDISQQSRPCKKDIFPQYSEYIHNNDDYVTETNETDLHLLAKTQSVIHEEESITGAVPLRCYVALLFPKQASQCKRVVKGVVLILLILSPPIYVASANWWIGVWALYPPEEQSNTIYVLVYVILVAMVMLSESAKTFAIYTTLFSGASVLHNQMFRSVLYSSVHFYESNPIGRVLNRFSQDQFNMDEKLPTAFAYTVSAVTALLTGLCLFIFVTPLLYIAVLPLSILIGIVIKRYLPVSRSLKRLESITKSPIYSYFTESFAGSSSIRSYHKQAYVLDRACGLIDKHTAVSIASFASQGWLGFRLNIIYCSALSLTCFVCIYLADTVASSSVGILLTYLFFGLQMLSFSVRKFAEVERFMTSTERVIEYGDLKTEKEEMEIDDSHMIHPPKTWPKRGDIEIHNLSVSYRSCLAPVLNNITVSIKHGERVGIVGRTGSGKSTLFKSLFRFIKPHQNEGYIKIDDVNIWDIPLHDLRAALFVIPQNCILFSASLRYNIDPFNEYSDETLNQILNEVTLNTIDLDCAMSEYGGNLSVGQTQLICVVRALLNYAKHKILLIDEATANIDPFTDKIIQHLFQSKLFKNKTVLTISHRMTNVTQYDKILVMDGGYVKEFDTPQHLLEDQDSMFFMMYNEIIGCYPVA
eukprot:633588_1